MSTNQRKASVVDSIEGVKLSTLAKKYGTPLYIYSYTTLVGNFRTIKQAFAELDPLIAFSVKCNTNRAVLRALVAEGAGLDIVSVGELERGLAAGVKPKKVVFAGVGKTNEEIARALQVGIGLFNIESEAEAEAIAAVARKMKKNAPAALRINPDVDASTHHYITTGKKENKFGIPFEGARKIFGRIARLRGMELTALHAHIGSQITKPEVYEQALGRLLELRDALQRDGHAISTMNLGGGFGIDYEAGEKPMDAAAVAKRLIPLLKAAGVRLILEPGRSIAGPAGFLLTRVIYIKPGEAKNFAIIDGGMNDLIRPALYSAHHRIALAGPARGGKKIKYDIVGPICESSDFLGKERELPKLKADDLLLVYDAGAYSMAMASNYNSRPRPAEVMVKGRDHFLVRERETIAELSRLESIPKFLR